MKIFFAFVAGALSLSAQAQTHSRAEVIVAMARYDDAELHAAIAELARSIDVSTQIESVESIELTRILEEPPPARSGLLARVWIRIESPTVLLVLTDPTGQRFLIRRLEVGVELDAVEIEMLAQIIATSLEALRAGGEIGVNRRVLVDAEHADQADPVFVPVASRESPSWFADVSLGEHVVMWDRHERPSHRVALRGLLGLEHSAHPAFVLEIGYLVPSIVGGPEVEVRLKGLGLGGGAGIRWERGRASIHSRVLGHVVFLHVEPRVTQGTSLRAEPARWTVLGMLEVAFGAGCRVLPRTSVFAEIGLRVDLTDARYVLERTGVTESVFDPYRIRPFAAVGLRVGLGPSGG